MRDIKIKSNKLLTIIVASLLITFTFSHSVYSQNVNTSSVVNSIAGYATVTDANGKVRRLKEGDTISEGDKINTGNNSSLELTLANGESHIIGPLQSFTYSLEAISDLPTSSTPANLSSAKSGKSLSRGSSSLSAAVSAGGSPVE